MSLERAHRLARLGGAIGVLAALALLGSTLMASNRGEVLVKIEGGSMRPTLDLGDVIEVNPGAVPKVNDVITFVHDNHRTTHRVVRAWTAVSPSGDRRTLFRTRGDANGVDDPWVVTDLQVIGVMVPKSVAATTAVTLERHTLLLAALLLPQLLFVVFIETANVARTLRPTTQSDDEDGCPERESNPQDVSIRGV